MSPHPAGTFSANGEWSFATFELGQIVARVDRLAAGNFGDCKALRGGLFELRIEWGPGYRVYYGMVGKACVLLLCGGDKRKQPSDIKRALEYLRDYRERTQ
jgi:putative addiction module killer protein